MLVEVRGAALMTSYMCAMNQGDTAPLLLSTSTTRCTSASTHACGGGAGKRA